MRCTLGGQTEPLIAPCALIARPSTPVKPHASRCARLRYPLPMDRGTMTPESRTTVMRSRARAISERDSGQEPDRPGRARVRNSGHAVFCSRMRSVARSSELDLALVNIIGIRQCPVRNSGHAVFCSRMRSVARSSELDLALVNIIGIRQCPVRNSGHTVFFSRIQSAARSSELDLTLVNIIAIRQCPVANSFMPQPTPSRFASVQCGRRTSCIVS